MSAQARQIAIVRAIKAAERAGWDRGSFRVVCEGDRVEIVPLTAPASVAPDPLEAWREKKRNGPRAA